MKFAALLILLFQAPTIDIKQTPKVSITRLDINQACKPLMMALEGVTSEIVDAIISGRPYKSVNEVKGKIPKEVWKC